MIQEQRYLKLLRSAIKEVKDWAHELFCSCRGKIKHSIRPKEYNLTMQPMHGWQHLIAYNFLTKLYRYFLFLNLDKQHSLLCIVHTHISLVEFKVWTMNILNMNELKTSSRCRANKLKLNEGNMFCICSVCFIAWNKSVSFIRGKDNITINSIFQNGKNPL